MKRIITAIMVAMASFSCLFATNPHRLVIPNVEGYKTLKGDFHIHTVFSDADVWPTNRVQEAYLEGLDFIMITDHLDTRLQHGKHKLDHLLNTNQDDSYIIANSVAKQYGVKVYHGAEVSRYMGPDGGPGHCNTHFISSAVDIVTQAEALDNEKKDNHFVCMEKALQVAKSQGSINIWNHPHWENQSPNVTVWHEDQTKLFNAGLLDGIEILNGYYSDCGYSPEAHHWCVEKNLIMVSGTDTHRPLALSVDYANGEHRPVTLVFAKENTEEGLKEAMMARRTCVFSGTHVYGTTATLQPLLDACLKIKVKSISDKKMVISVVNKSSIPVSLSKVEGESETLRYVRTLVIRPFEEREMTFTQIGGPSTEYSINYHVDNWMVDADVPLHWNLKFSK